MIFSENRCTLFGIMLDHRVDPALLWEIAQRDLLPLKAFAEHVVGETER